MRAPNVSWDKCCTPKSEGGLGIKNSKIWNKALLGKYIWWRASKTDHLWVKWINHVYMKGTHWCNYDPPNDCSWTWKKIVHTMGSFKQAYTSDCWLASDKPYTIANGYQWLRQVHTLVPWRYVCWNPLNIPKCSFIFWAVQLQRLLTQDRMMHMGFGQSTLSYLCATDDENHSHLFYQCLFSQKCVEVLQNTLGVRFSPVSLSQWYSVGGGRSKLQRNVICACHVSLTYHIWKARNKVRLEQFVAWPWKISQLVIKDVLARFWARNRSIITPRDRTWLLQLSKF
ncbi:uncharacterized protein LOC141651489 [Silene latifolia]|uniref:uncharacterized protein LOC141651489 n=1 Tax=Silene latifolia TaxID=37657 RepID=UPI003D78AEAC